MKTILLLGMILFMTHLQAQTITEAGLLFGVRGWRQDSATMETGPIAGFSLHITNPTEFWIAKAAITYTSVYSIRRYRPLRFTAAEMWIGLTNNTIYGMLGGIYFNHVEAREQASVLGLGGQVGINVPLKLGRFGLRAEAGALVLTPNIFRVTEYDSEAASAVCGNLVVTYRL